MKKIVLLYSGGADSAYMLILALRMGHSIFLVSYDYGQKHVKELEYSKALVDKITTKIVKQGKCVETIRPIDLNEAFKQTRSNLLGDKSRHLHVTGYPGVHEMHVPGRNSVFLGVALSIAETRRADEIWIGCDYSDRILQFPDCYQEWIYLQDQAAQIAGSVPIRIKAPLLGLEKQDVLDLLVAEGIDLKDVYSGYEPPKGND